MNEMTDIESNVLKTVTLGATSTRDSEQFELVQYRVNGQSKWHYGLVGTLILPAEEGVDIDELDENTAIEIMGKLFNIHITDERGVCRF